ncbi:group 1 glycosyl transferase [Mucilaginibacter hurinus]|uniref:Group 1 glycosyl transferase n=1 Tax=Mucilaginibacter hurinus TaxID=2201324 RepID=A0A367GTY1_9SPHI|nr:glycosyltransferase family 4 protein [Mucilaginibacter hurinus]RCH56638.1 group 1 glycosyl transferase [Mucilaginibacter hurinus]
MNISYITTYDARDVHQWSGLGHYIAAALQQHAELDFVGNLDTSITGYLRLKAYIYSKMGQRYLFDRVPLLVRGNAVKAERRIKPDADIIFSPSSLPINLIQSGKPKVFYTDATFAGMIDFYPYFTNLAAESIRNGNKLEQAAFDNCQLAIYSSEWAAKTAIDYYNVDPAKIKVVPFGANIECDRVLADIESIANNKDTVTCHLLFLGVEWDRKGGDVALAITRELNQRGVPAILHIAGIQPDFFKELPPYVKNYGFVSKSTHEGQQLLKKLFTQSHFLLLPSKADCTPVVYAEANSFGLPCITTDVGGIPTMIKDDINGKMFSLYDNPELYVNYIQAVFRDSTLYTELSRSSFNEYATRLNWDASGKALMALLNAL